MDSEFQQALGDGEEQGTGRTGQPGVLQSMGSQRVRHDLATGQMEEDEAGFSPSTERYTWKRL